MLFISSTFFNDNILFSDALKLCEQNDLFNIEIGSNHGYEDDYSFIKKYNKFNFLIHNYFPIPKKSFVINIASLNDEIRKNSISHIIKAIDFSDEIGSKLYTFHPGFITDPNGANLFKKNYDFQWDDKELKNSSYKIAFDNLKESLELIIRHAEKRSTSIAFETEGSFTKKEHLLMQKPEEYKNLFKTYSSEQIGISLNIGHLILASKAFNFNIDDFINLVESYIVSMELSHNNGIEDEHLPLKDDGWYWDLIFDKRFNNSFKILEFRNTHIDDIKKTIQLYESKKKKYG